LQTDAGITGTFLAGPREAPLKEVALDGNKLSFRVDLEREGNTFTLSFTGTVAGDTITGKITVPGRGERDWKATRVRRKVLYVTQTQGFRHGCLELSHEIMRQIAEKTGLIEATVTEDAAKDLTAENLRNYDAVMFYTTGSLPLSAEQKQALLDFVQGGKAFVGVHSATDTFYDWPEYGEMIGAYFDGHPWTQEIGVIVEDATHAAAKHLGAEFRIQDEIYQYRAWSRDKVHVLLRMDNSTVEVNKEGVKREDKDFALAWCHRYGEGRVFFTGLGHFNEVWQDERFQTHLLNGILWATGDLYGEATMGTRGPQKEAAQ
jgi:type 1 glutamine amidotransferase